MTIVGRARSDGRIPAQDFEHKVAIFSCEPQEGKMQAQIHPIHFEDFSGHQFERLCFAYLLRRPEFSHVDWYGQLGKDRGRDIVCDHVDGSIFVYQCANYRRLTERKARGDLEKLAKGPRSKGAIFRLIVGGSVSGSLKDKVSTLATAAGFVSSQTWSGVEFEEHLRRDTPDLLLRFTSGVEFPELPLELAAFAADGQKLSDEIILKALTVAFDRPAFKTPFRKESSLPRFRTAIAETIDTLNTGNAPVGKVIPPKNDIADKAKRKSVNKPVERLAALRAAFDEYIQNDGIQHCKCGDKDCPVYQMTDATANDMVERRRLILADVHALNPEFDPEFYEFS
jgi:hypothetical protein